MQNIDWVLVIVPLDEGPRIVGLVSDHIPIEVLTTNALVSSEIVAWLRWFNTPYREVVAAFCAGRRLPFRRRQSRPMARPMLPLLINGPVVFHSPSTESQRGLSQQVRELLVPSRLVLGEHPPFEGKVLDE